MPAGQPCRIRRSMGLGLARHLLRRSLLLQGAAGIAGLSTVISRPATGDEARTAGMSAHAASARAAQN